MSKSRHYPLTHDEFLRLNAELKDAELRVYLYLMTLNPFPNSVMEIDTAQISERLGITRRTVQRAVKCLQELQLIEGQLFGFDQKNNIEYQIRNRLKSEVGGEVEVVTAVGRIDLLTVTEVIEIKNINDWKEALGKMLAYSAFFPEHSKRIHLFGHSDLTKLVLAQATCSEFDITVTFEEVQP